LSKIRITKNDRFFFILTIEKYKKKK
jgi:hypothetical protein